MAAKKSSLTELSVNDFTKLLASDAPAPGGGSAAALSGALGAALISMVCRLTVGREKFAEFETVVRETLAKADNLYSALLDCVTKDTQAFEDVIAAFKMPKASEPQKSVRSHAIQEGYKKAILSPEETAKNCLEVMRLANGLLYRCNKNAASDLAVSALQAQAGLEGALENMNINLPSIKDGAFVAEKRTWMAHAHAEGEGLIWVIREGVARMLS